MSNVIELIEGKYDKVICLTAIGDEFLNDFNKISLPHFKNYCLKYGLGLILLKDYINEDDKNFAPYNSRPNLQRLLLPSFVKKHFSKYKFICDIDVDCLPGQVARNIFDFTDFRNEKNIFLTNPTPKNFSRENIGKRLSILRNIYNDNNFPINSLLSGSDQDEKEIYNLKFDGQIATIGTCVAKIDTLSDCFLKVYKSIQKNFSGYLQHYTNQTFRKYGNLNWLPYEFQAIWNFEVALYYPFLFSDQYSNLMKQCVMQSLLRVDMLHFAGNWAENKIFKFGPFLEFENDMDKYLNKIPEFLETEISINSYGKIKDKN